MTQAIHSFNQIKFGAITSGRRRSARSEFLCPILPSLHRRPAWLNGACLAMIWVALLIYGTLIPFDFDLAGHGDRLQDLGALLAAVLTSIQWFPATGGVEAWTVDLVTNLLLYGPFGLFVRWGAQRHGCRGWSQIVITVTVLFLVSYLLESAQSLTPSRVGSWYDVAMNTTGGLLFALAAGPFKTAACTTTFFVYRKTAYFLQRLMMLINAFQRNRTLLIIMIGVDCLLFAVWCSGVASASITSPRESNWLPFARQFEMSYDIAMIDIGHRLVQYGFLTVLLSLHLISMPLRRRAAWLVMTVVIVTTLSQLLGTGSTAFSGDITEPTIALMAFGFLVVTVHVLAHAIRKSDRRKSDRRKSNAPVAMDLRRV